MDEIKKLLLNDTEKTLAEKLAEEFEKIPDDKKEIVATLLIGTCQGVQLAEQMQRATA